MSAPNRLPLPRVRAVRRDISREALGKLKILLKEGCGDAGVAEELNQRGHRDSLGEKLNVKYPGKFVDGIIFRADSSNNVTICTRRDTKSTENLPPNSTFRGRCKPIFSGSQRGQILHALWEKTLECNVSNHTRKPNQTHGVVMNPTVRILPPKTKQRRSAHAANDVRICE